jgi:polysaccharide biosynthesis/export protein
MSANNNRHALAAAALLFSTVCVAQNGAPSLSNIVPSSDTGVFRPAAPVVNPPVKGGPAGQMPQQLDPVYNIGKEYRVGANDLLDVEVLNLDNGAKRTVRVNAAGYVTLPLIGQVTVAGLTQQEIETHIAKLYGDKYLQNPQVSVFIREFTTQRITVDGAVAKPGIYPLVGEMTLLRVIALAGGFGQIANSSQVMLFRQGEKGDRQVATFDVDRIRSGKDPDPMIRGDDLIVVQRDSARALLKDSIFRDIVDSVNPFSVFSR